MDSVPFQFNHSPDSSVRFSVVLTTYNRPEGLALTLRSLAAQTMLPDEVIVADNCSAVDVTPVVEELRASFPHLQLIRRPRNLGMPGNLNEAIKETRGEWIINLHDADRYEPDFIETLAACSTRYPEAGMIFWPAHHNYHLDRCIDPITDGKAFFEKHYYLFQSSKIWGTAAVKREVYEKVLPFDWRFDIWADVDMWMKVCGVCPIAYTVKPLVDIDKNSGVAGWNWDKFIRMQQTILLNITRIYGENRQDCEQRLAKQYQLIQKLWLRQMGANIRWLRLAALPRGFMILLHIIRRTFLRIPISCPTQGKVAVIDDAH